MTIGQKIRELKEATGLSYRKMGERAGIAFTQLRLIANEFDPKTHNAPTMTIDALSRLCNAFDYDLSTFLEETGYIKKKAPTIQLVEDDNLRRLTAIYNALEYDLKANLLSYAENIVEVYNVSVVYNEQRKVSSN